ncbi:MAG: DMT family transporter [Pseudomonadota bacterium]
MTTRKPESSRPVTGVLWMLLTGLCFVCMTALVKVIGSSLHPVQTGFLRYFLGLIFILPLLPTVLGTRLTSRQWGLFGLRGVLHSAAVVLWFFAMTQIPLAEVTAMNYMTPVYVTLGAVLFLGERLAARRITAVLVALAGALIILRPGFREISPGHLAMLGATLVLGGSYLLAKVMVDQLSPAVVMVHMTVWVTIFLAPLAIAVWTPPTLPELGVLFLIASFATAGHFAMTLALRAAPLAVTQPVTFVQLIWSVALGALIFNEGLDLWVITGGAVILASVSFITWRETVLKRRSETQGSTESQVP